MMVINRKVTMFLLAIAMCTSTATARPTAKITVKAVDEQRTVIGAARVTVGFVVPSTGIGTTEIQQSGTTDSNGEFSASSCSLHLLGLHVDKDGYYQSGAGYEFKSSSMFLNRWEPWNPTIEVVLKKKRNPVAMYQKYLEALPVPILNTPVGYDMEKGDWVSPHGNGMTSDLVFNCTNNYASFSEANTSCDISFSNEQDGLQEYRFDEKNQSLYRWPFEAPENGYGIKKLNKWMSVKPKEEYKSNYQEKVNYLFRVRTVVDKNGVVVRANYGKIEGDFRVYKKAEVNFSYIFNPDGTRNLEEDPKKNLFKKK
ncbi:MAG: hypothetical protein HGA96_17305 [Desulfobulbaceae bacterium]|nr:hypothetical protein [Desulfobulbaceae bacterium]